MNNNIKQKNPTTLIFLFVLFLTHFPRMFGISGVDYTPGRLGSENCLWDTRDQKPTSCQRFRENVGSGTTGNHLVNMRKGLPRVGLMQRQTVPTGSSSWRHCLSLWLSLVQSWMYFLVTQTQKVLFGHRVRVRSPIKCHWKKTFPLTVFNFFWALPQSE